MNDTDTPPSQPSDQPDVRPTDVTGAGVTGAGVTDTGVTGAGGATNGAGSQADHAHQSQAAPAAKPKKKHKARIEHKIPGRIRMKVPHAKSNPEVLKTYAAAFSSIPGVTRIQAKPDTGSIVLEYDPKYEDAFHQHLHHTCEHHDTHVHTGERPGDEVDEIYNRIENEAEFLAQHSQIARVTVDAFKNFDRELKVLTSNTIDMKILLAGGLAGFTFFEIGAEAATPMWVTLVLFSLNHLTELHVPHHPAAQPVAGPAPSR
jgi:hypothetical protein